jgi:O-antigen/teichoic acid export membrane protein
MRRQLSNFTYGLLDYAAYPFGMLAVAPLIMHNLGVAQYGVWTVATAIVSVGSIVASGFGDANIQKVASQRSAGNSTALLRLVRASMGIHLVLGIGIALALWLWAPSLARNLAHGDGGLKQTSLSCIRIAALLTIIRAVETVCISTQRAFERYGTAVRISVAGRLLGLGAAAVLAVFARGVADMMGVALGIATLVLLVQLLQLGHLLQSWELTPAFDRFATRELLRFGIFAWLLSASGVVFGQADRLIGGAAMGASAIVSYALCAQISQAIYGLTAAGLHFVFPYAVRLRAVSTKRELKKALALAFLANLLLVFIGTGLVFAFSHRILHLLAVDTIARASAPLLLPVLAGAALLACSVTGSYAMLALDRVRQAALLNVAGALALLLVIACGLSRFGLTALIAGRLAFALIALLVYIPLLRELRSSRLSAGPLASYKTAAEGV